MSSPIRSNQLVQPNLAERLAGLSDKKRMLLERKLGISLEPGYDVLAATLSAQGITHVYAMLGGPMMMSLNAFRSVGIEVISVRHQQSAVLMAAGQNFLAGKLQAVATVSAGPATTNAVTGVLVARDNGWPVIVFASKRPQTVHTDAVFQYLDGLPIFESLCKWSATITDVQGLQEGVENGVGLAMEGRPGPVFVEISEDVMSSFSSTQPRVTEKMAKITTGQTRETGCVVESIQKAERPLLIIGPDIRWSDIHGDLLAAIEAVELPFVTTPMIRGFLPDNHKLCVNEAHHQAWMSADLILVAGNPIDWTLRFGTEFAKQADVIHIGFNKPHDHAACAPGIHINGEPGVHLVDILQKLANRFKGSQAEQSRSRWLQQTQELCFQKNASLEKLFKASPASMTLHNLSRVLSESLPDNAITVFDGNMSMLIGQSIVPALRPASRLMAGFNGCMGVGLPYAIAAKLNNPQSPVVLVAGDVAFSFSAMELETAVRMNVPVVIVIANNGGQVIYQDACKSGEPDFASLTPTLRFDQLATSIGANGMHVKSLDEFEAAIATAIDSNRPIVIDFKIDTAVCNNTG